MTTIQDVAELAVTNRTVGEFVQTACAAFKSLNPATSFDWLASVETDPDLRFCYAHAAEAVRAREGGGRD